MKIDLRMLLALVLSVLVPQVGAQSDLPDPIILPGPSVPAGGGASGSITLELVESAANQITDEDAWWERNQLERPEVYVRYPALSHGTIPATAPESYKGQPLMAVLISSERRFFVYGAEIYKARYLLVEAGGGGKIEYAFDAAAYGTVAWAAIVDGTLYLANNPGNLSAADGGGAQLFAIDLSSNQLKWVSDKKQCSGQFVVIAGSIVCAYGFTGEPDFIYVLDRFTGAVSQTIKLKTAAKWLIRKGQRLYVRCYNTDNIYRIDVRD